MSAQSLATGSDGRAFTDPWGATQTEWKKLFAGAPPSPQVASNIYAQLTRDQWSNYMNTFVPIENQLIQYATDKTQPDQAMAQAHDDIESSYGMQAGSTARRLAGLGVTLDADQQASSDRAFGLSKALADVQSQNTARDLTVQRQQSILGNPTPAVGPTNIPQGV